MERESIRYYNEFGFGGVEFDGSVCSSKWRCSINRMFLGLGRQRDES